MIRHSADPLGENKTTKETFESLFLSDSLFLFIYLFIHFCFRMLVLPR